MRIICILGASITFLYVLTGYLINIQFNLLPEKSIPVFFFLNIFLLIGHIVFFSIYSFRRKFHLLFAFWILNYLVFFWYQFKIITFDWNRRLHQADIDAFEFYAKISASAVVLLAIAILVSKARSRILLMLFAIISLVITIITTKEWIAMDGIYYLLFMNVLSPLLIAVNYVMELKNFTPNTKRGIRPRMNLVDDISEVT